MKEKKLSSSLKMIAFGMLLIVAHLKFNNFDILVDWVGYLLIFTGLTPIIKDSRYAAVIKALGIVATVWSLIEWVCGFIGISLNNIILTLVFTVVYALYFYLFITAVAFCTTEENRHNRIRLAAIVNTVLHIVTTVMALIPPLQMISLVSGFGNLAVRIWICIELFLLANSVKKQQEEYESQQDSYSPCNENEMPIPLHNEPAEEEVTTESID
ncbi:MAG: hypothetical protein IJ491_02895 [Clostridia bacterium]|nr:hypothetical protein [Clostridia bacterium]